MRLIEPAADYCRQIREYRDAFLECGDSMDGTSDLRHQLNEYLEKFGGHIGYSVAPFMSRMKKSIWRGTGS